MRRVRWEKLEQSCQTIVAWIFLVFVVGTFLALIIMKIVAPHNLASKHDNSLGDIVADSRCVCICPHDLNTTKHYNTTVFQIQVGSPSECTCENVLPESNDVLCLRCECKFESRNSALIALIVYGMLVMIFGGVFPCAIFVCVQPILRRRSLFSSAATGYRPLQESSSLFNMRLRAQQARWRNRVQDQRAEENT